MKNALLLLTALFLFACSKEDSAPELSLTQGDFENMVFHATFEQPSKPGSKVFADENLHLRWNADDRVSIFVKNTYNKEFSFTGADGDNGGEFEPVVSTTFGTGNDIPRFYAVYPYSSATSINDYNPYNITLSLPSVQTYREGSFGVGANTMVAVSNDDFLGFKNVCGFLRFRFWGNNISIKSIKLEGNNGEKIAGKAVVTPVSGGNPSIVMDASATGSITLNAPMDASGAPVTVPIGTSSTDFTEFWFVVPPTTFSNGIKVTVTDALGGIFERVITTESITINRGAVKSVPALEVTPDYTVNNVQFSDAAFKAYCVANFDTDHNGEISFDEAEVVETIDLSEVDAQSITSLTGLESFTGLRNLLIVEQNIPDLPLATLTNLRSLKCHFNYYLGELDLSGNSMLQTLDLAFCLNLESLDLSNNTRLTEVRIQGGMSGNQIVGQLSSINLSTNSRIKILYLWQNALTTVDVSHCTALEELRVNYNRLTTLDISANTNLKSLVCTNNNLTSLITGQNNRLESIQADENPFTELTINGKNSLKNVSLDGCSSLQEVDLSSNSLENISLSGCSNLNRLDVSSNDLTQLDLTGLSNLNRLNVRSNDLTQLNLAGLSNLEYLDCVYNSLTSLSLGATILISLDASSNQLSSLIGWKGGNSTLKNLLIDHNNFSGSFYAGNYSALDVFSCTHNQITTLDVSGNTVLSKLYCYNNNLTSLSVVNNTQMTDLGAWASTATGSIRYLTIALGQNITYRAEDNYTVIDPQREPWNTIIFAQGSTGN